MDSPNGLPVVYVGRGSQWGNPFRIGLHGTARECVQKYVDHLLPYKHGQSLTAYFQSEAMLHLIQDELRGKNLACWCKPGEVCHADWLLKTANEDLGLGCGCCG